MNENENFESLRRLLALKRHEVPPPGYFHRFSGDVIARIRAGEQSQSEGFLARLSWLAKFLQLFEAKPAFAGAFASALCLVLVFGIVSADRSDVSVPQSLLTQSAAIVMPFTPAATVALQQTSAQPAMTLDTNNPVLSLQPQSAMNSLFASQQQPSPLFQQVGFTPGN